MARPLRIEFDGALHHVMARGNAREAIFLSDADRRHFTDQLWRVAERFEWTVWAYCLMDNHYHLLIETPAGGMSRGMRELNGVYTQAFNRRHQRVGHVLQGRFKSVLVDKNSYLLELSRYIVLNPVRAGMVTGAGEWPWSSYQALMGKAVADPRLAVSKTLEMFSADTGAARRNFARFVQGGVDAEDPTAKVLNQVFLGSEQFVEQVTRGMGATALPTTEVPRRQRQWTSLASLLARESDRDTSIRLAYQSGNFTLAEIGRHVGLHYATVSKIARRGNH